MFTSCFCDYFTKKKLIELRKGPELEDFSIYIFKVKMTNAF